MRAPVPDVGSVADLNLLRRADAAGQRLFRELVVSRIAWRTASEASRLIAADVVGFSLSVAGCEHPQPCHLHHCFDRLEMKAMLGNRGPRLPGLRLIAGRGRGRPGPGRPARPSGCPATDRRRSTSSWSSWSPTRRASARSSASRCPSAGTCAACSTSGGAPRAGSARARWRRWGACAPTPGAALAAARDRARVEEVAAMRERRRLARALHDDFGQRLFGIGVSAQLAHSSASAGRPDLLAHLAGLEQQIAGASTQLRATLKALDRPAAPAGAVAVKLREDAASFSARTSVPAHLLVLGDPSPVDEVARGADHPHRPGGAAQRRAPRGGGRGRSDPRLPGRCPGARHPGRRRRRAGAPAGPGQRPGAGHAPRGGGPLRRGRASGARRGLRLDHEGAHPARLT